MPQAVCPSTSHINLLTHVFQHLALASVEDEGRERGKKGKEREKGQEMKRGRGRKREKEVGYEEMGRSLSPFILI